MTEYLEITESGTYQSDFRNWSWRVILTKADMKFKLEPVGHWYPTKEEAEGALNIIKATLEVGGLGIKE